MPLPVTPNRSNRSGNFTHLCGAIAIAKNTKHRRKNKYQNGQASHSPYPPPHKSTPRICVIVKAAPPRLLGSKTPSPPLCRVNVTGSITYGRVRGAHGSWLHAPENRITQRNTSFPSCVCVIYCVCEDKSRRLRIYVVRRVLR